ncbi:MAG: ribose-phosphate diphosphokinase [Methanobacteriota archaeon]|nr:MAG: ribose-phosphate diphosphokinase [Euryarchaeota archaeon]
MVDLKIIPGPASTELARETAKLLGEELLQTETKRFPDGETYFRFLDDIRGEHVVVIQSTGPPQDNNLLALLLLVHTARDLGAERVTLVVPYLAYARQDQRFRSGEPVSAKYVAEMIGRSGVSRVYTFEIHKEHILDCFGVPAFSLSTLPVIHKFLSGLDMGDLFVVAPDRGAERLAQGLSQLLGTEYGWIEKFRDRESGEITISKHNLDVENKNVIVIDDMISTGGTIAKAARYLLESGAKKVLAICTHLLLVGDAEKRLREAGVEEIIGTNTIPSKFAKISVAPLLAEAIKDGL